MTIPSTTATDKKISLTVVSDVICPWCYIGYKELMIAVDKVKKQHPGTEVDIEYRPFLLDPKLNCKEPIDKWGYLTAKFGETRMKMIGSVIGSRGEELGIHYKWNGKLRQTTSDHRLLLAAYQKDPKLQIQLMEKLFKAYFEEEKDNGDLEMLAEMADELGIMTKAEAAEFLRSDKLLKEVQDYIIEAQKNGVTGVPCTVINQKYAISGGQKSDMYLNIFEKLLTGAEVS